MNAPKETIAVRLPPALVAAIKAAAAQEQTTVSALVEAAIAAHFGHGPTPLTPTGDRLTALEEKVAALEAAISALTTPTPRKRSQTTQANYPQTAQTAQTTVSDSTMRRRWQSSGDPQPFQKWAESQGFRREGTGGGAKWHPQTS